MGVEKLVWDFFFVCVRKIENRFFKIWSISTALLLLGDLTFSSFSLLSVSQNRIVFEVSNSANSSQMASIQLFG